MKLEELLSKQQEILEYLRGLRAMHHAALFEEETVKHVPLGQVRKNIGICLKDLCRLNSWITKHNGGIRKSIFTLNKQENKLLRLRERERLLIRERETWKEISKSEIKGKGEEVISVSMKHQALLSAYIDSVGVINTTLNGSDRRMILHLPKEKIVSNLALLKEANTFVMKDLNQLESLLKSFKKNKDFIQTELTGLESQFQFRTNSIDLELDEINRSRWYIVLKMGLLRHKTQLNVQSDLLEMSPDSEDMRLTMSQLDDFIKMRRDSLTGMLNSHKEDLHRLHQQLDAWLEIIGIIESLEELIRTKFSSASVVDPVELYHLINETIANIKMINYEHCATEVATCIKDEIITLETARNQLFDGFTPRSSDAQRLSIISETPGFMVIGTSSPKKWE